MSATYDDHTALVIVDVQNDFADPKGTLSVRGAEEVVDVANREGSDEFVRELQDFTRERLAQHEFPRIVEFVSELPKNPAGKVHRKMLRDREAAKAAEGVN